MNADKRIDELVKEIKKCHKIYKEPCDNCTQYSGKCGEYWELIYLVTMSKVEDAKWLQDNVEKTVKYLLEEK